MDLRPDEITGIIKSRIKDYGSKIRLEDTGTVVTVGDGIVRIHGLEKCMMNELLEFENGVRCMALNLEQDFVGYAGLRCRDQRGRYSKAYRLCRICTRRRGTARTSSKRTGTAYRRQGRYTRKGNTPDLEDRTRYHYEKIC